MARKVLGKVRGSDGATPCIGENGNWFIGETDTGYSAVGDLSEIQAEIEKQSMEIEEQKTNVGNINNLVNYIADNLFDRDYIGSETVDSEEISYVDGVLENVIMSQTVGSRGQMSKLSGRYSTYFIPCDGSKTIYFKATNEHTEFKVPYVFAFSSDKKSIGLSSYGVSSYKTPPATAYIRLLFRTLDYKDNFYMGYSNEMEYKEIIDSKAREQGNYLDKYLNTVINVTKYGVDVNNSAETNTLILNKIIDDIENLESNTLYFPNGKYLIAPLEIRKSNIRFLGDGNSSTILKKYATVDERPMLSFIGVSDTGHISGNILENITFENEPNKWNESTEPLVKLECVSNFTITHCNFRGKGSALGCYEVYESYVERCNFSGCGHNNATLEKPCPVVDLKTRHKSKVQQNNIGNDITLLLNAGVYFDRCHFEPYYSSAFCFSGDNNNTISIANCKFETGVCALPTILINGTVAGIDLVNGIFMQIGEIGSIISIEENGGLRDSQINLRTSVSYNKSEGLLGDDIIKIKNNARHAFSGNKVEIIINPYTLSGADKMNGHYCINWSTMEQYVYMLGNSIELNTLESANISFIDVSLMPIINDYSTLLITGAKKMDKIPFSQVDADGYTCAVFDGHVWKRSGKLE